MITIKQWMDTVNYRITDGSSYGWKCYGPDSYILSAWNGLYDNGGWSLDIVFDTSTHEVYEVSVCDFTNNCAYRLVNPQYKTKHDLEAQDRNVSANQAWDDVNYIDFDLDLDWLDKASSIVKSAEIESLKEGV
jgi:hypothetical protein